MTVAEELWGAETRKAVDNFPVSGERVPVPVIRWLGRIKAAAARVNAELGLLDADIAERVATAGDEVAAGEHDDQFPIDVFQTGSGTSSNMNANEVIANLAGGRRAPERPRQLRPVLERRVPLGRAPGRAGRGARRTCCPRSSGWSSRCRPRRRQFADIVKTGRTHLMDAVPVTLGPGVRRLRRADPARPAADRGRAAARGADPAGRNGHRHRAEHASRVRRAGARATRARHRPRDPPARASLRGAGQPRRAGRALGRAEGARRVAHQDRERHRLAGLRARAPGSPRSSCRSCRRAARSCRARSTR